MDRTPFGPLGLSPIAGGLSAVVATVVLWGSPAVPIELVRADAPPQANALSDAGVASDARHFDRRERAGVLPEHGVSTLRIRSVTVSLPRREVVPPTQSSPLFAPPAGGGPGSSRRVIRTTTIGDETTLRIVLPVGERRESTRPDTGAPAIESAPLRFPSQRVGSGDAAKGVEPAASLNLDQPHSLQKGYRPPPPSPKDVFPRLIQPSAMFHPSTATPGATEPPLPPEIEKSPRPVQAQIRSVVKPASDAPSQPPSDQATRTARLSPRPQPVIPPLPQPVYARDAEECPVFDALSSDPASD